jgi:streptomycin 6-kinase
MNLRERVALQAMVRSRKAWPMFNDYLERWGLTPDGEPNITATSKLLPVRMNGLPAKLKIAVTLRRQVEWEVRTS